VLNRRVKSLTRILADGKNNEHGLKRSLGPWTLTAMGVGGIIGTGIFVLTGVAAATRAGPALTISFVIAGIVSALAALCYAEVSRKIPIAGSAYTYAYATLGELFAWIIGWDLVLEYGVGAATVSIGWSGYFVNFMQTALGWKIPIAWAHSPFDPVHGIANLPAAFIILLLTALLAKGTHESSTVNTIVVTLKVSVVLFFIAVGMGHVNPTNWHLPAGPATGAGGYFPFGWTGVLGFDAVSTAAEESLNPNRDLPFAILASLAICTLLYIPVVVVLTGMVPFNELNVPSPVAFAVIRAGLPWAGVIISVGAIAGLTTVLLVLLFGQSRIFFSMSRDGLLPPFFTRLHRTWRTPIFSTLFFGIVIALTAAFTPIEFVGSLTNMGVLAAFMLTSAAVPILRKKHPELNAGGFQVPFGPRLIPALSALTAFGLMVALMFNSPRIWGIPLPWFAFTVWLAIGLVIYYAYGRNNSIVGENDEKAA
jgi:APA family basic amino acid/polyamine antiporter